MTTSFTRSQKGRTKIVVDGFVYNHTKTYTSGGQIWYCEQRYSSNCSASVSTDGNVLRHPFAGHTHRASTERPAVLDALHQLRTDAITAADTKPSAIVNRRVVPRIAARLPSVANLRQAILYARRKRLPADPPSANAIVLRNEWATTLSDETWWHDVRLDGQRALIFTTMENSRILSVSLILRILLSHQSM
jgi:hypothetical protein